MATLCIEQTPDNRRKEAYSVMCAIPRGPTITIGAQHYADFDQMIWSDQESRLVTSQ
jgi:hypothetical protein